MANENENIIFTFRPKFKDFITLYRGVESVWVSGAENVSGDSLTLNVIPVSQESALAAEVDQEVFVRKVTSTQIVTFTYTTEWTPNIVEYGITITAGTAQNGDVIQADYRRGIDGILYAKMENGTVQTLGPVSSYYYAVSHGFTGTYSDWVDVLNNSSANALKAEGYATGTQNTTPVESGTYFENNALYYRNQAHLWANYDDSAVLPSLTNNAKFWADEAHGWTNNKGTGTYGANNNAKYWTEQSKSYTNGKDLNNQTVQDRATDNAEFFKDEAKRWANFGTDGISPTTTNNAKAYATLARQWTNWNGEGTPSATNNAKAYADAAKSEADGIRGAISTTSYANSLSGRIIPSGVEWTLAPNPQQGQYLWTKTVLNWMAGDPSTIYQVTYIGNNGSGSIAEINGHTESVVTLNGSEIPVNGTIGALSVNDQINLKANINSPTFTGVPIAPTAVDGTNNDQIATTRFVNNAFRANDAMTYEGTIGAPADHPTITSLPAEHKVGWAYKVITSGTYAGQHCDIGDMVICVADNTWTQDDPPIPVANDNDWTVVQNNIDIMVGATTSTSGSSGLVPVPAAGDQTKYLRGDGVWNTVELPLDMKGATSLVAGTHGLVPAPSIADRTKYLKGDGTWNTIELPDDMTGADSSTNGNHGLVPTPLAGDQEKCLLGDGTWGHDDTKADKMDTVLFTTLSRGRSSNSTAGEGSFAFGMKVIASGRFSHAEGDMTEASGISSHAEGSATEASGMNSHAEGDYTVSSGENSHAEGHGTNANGLNQHSSGQYNSTKEIPEWETETHYYSGNCVKQTITNGETQGVLYYLCVEENIGDTLDQPSWNPIGLEDATRACCFLETVGNGTTFNNRSNARALDWNGNEYIKGDLYVGCNADSTGGTKIMPNALITPSQPFNIPSTSVSYNLPGITSDHVLLFWNFSSYPENDANVVLSWQTYNGYFTITKEAGSASGTIKPIFGLAANVTATLRS